MRSGNSGYRQMLGIRAAPLLRYQTRLAINPPVKIFVREDRLASLADPAPRITVQE